jgi:predicted RNA binding protein YcfA (HicA-like mRNA interferase family)
LPKLPRLSAEEAEGMLLRAGFRLERSKGSHRIYMKEKKRIVLPFHVGKTLHPKIVNQLLKTLKD